MCARGGLCELNRFAAVAHSHALRCGRDRRYIDVTTAFVHAAEKDNFYTSAPKGQERKGYFLRAMREIRGRPGGFRDFAEWLAPLVDQQGFPPRHRGDAVQVDKCRLARKLVSGQCVVPATLMRQPRYGASATWAPSPVHV